jgi:hypothetical protein
MPFGQSAILTLPVLNGVRRVAYLVHTLQGTPPREAMRRASETAIVAASTVATSTAIVTLDPVGGALSAGYIALESQELDRISNFTGAKNDS